MRQVCAVLKEPKLTQIQAAIVIIGLPRVNLLVETALAIDVPHTPFPPHPPARTSMPVHALIQASGPPSRALC